MNCRHVFTILLALSAFGLSSCKPKEVNYSKLGYDSINSTLLDPETNTPFNGLGIQTTKDGKVIGHWPCKNGRLDGVMREWYPSGAKKTEAIFVNGEHQGLTIEWLESGAVYNERVYDHEKIVSEKKGAK